MDTKGGQIWSMVLKVSKSVEQILKGFNSTFGLKALI